MTIQGGPSWLFDGSEIPDPFGRAAKALRFLDMLRHPKARTADKALRFDLWQSRIIQKIYGPSHDDGRRICGTVYLQVGRGNRKTSLGGALALLHTFGSERIPNGQVLSAAADRKQARIAFEEAVSIVNCTPQLQAAAQIQDFKNRLRHPKSGAVYEAISCDAATNYGRTGDFSLVDELWAHKKADLWLTIRTGAVKVAGSLLVITTTAGRGTNTPDFPIYEYAKKVASGEVVDPSFLPIIFEADRDCDWLDEDVWAAVNPGLRHGYPDLHGLRQFALECRERPADRAAFQQFHLGIRQEHSVSPFVEMSVYDEGSAPIDMEDLRGRKCFVAGDMSATTDMSAVVAAFPDDDDGVTVLAWFFLPKEGLQARADRDGLPYVRWVQDGFITATEGNAIDYRAIEAKIREAHELYEVQEDAFDRAYAQPVMGPLLDDGFPVVTLQQGWLTQSPALNLLEGVIVNRKFRHGGNPVLRTHFEAVAIHTDSAGNRTMHKGKSRGRIDGAAATWMAVSRALSGDSSSSIYSNVEERPEGLLFI